MIWATKWLLFCSFAPLVSSRSILEAFTKVFSARNNDLTLSMMDEIVQYMTGTGVFDRDMYNNIKQCIENTDSKAFVLQSKIWEKMIAFWESRGLPEDVWGTFDYGYLENNKTTGSFSGMEFIEPCNCASNIAYYRTLLELCDKQNKLELKCISPDVINPFIKAAGYLVASSYFHHASKTRLGLSLDQKIIDTMVLILHQKALSGIPYNSYIHDLSPTPRQYRALGALDALEDIYQTDDISEWQAKLDALDLPPRFQIITAFSAIGLVLTIDEFVIRAIAPSLTGVFDITEEEQEFITDEFLPRLIEALRPYRQKGSKKKELLTNTIAALGKFGYSFFWLSGSEISQSKYGQILNYLGSLAIPSLNAKLNFVNTYDYSDDRMQTGRGLYPGDTQCNKEFPHPKWHTQSSISIVDAVNLADELCLATNS